MRRDFFAIADGHADDGPPPTKKIRCTWCGEGIYVQYRVDEKKHCANCGHQGVLEREKCGCADCVLGRLRDKGVAVPASIVPNVAAGCCPTCGQKVPTKRKGAR